MRSAICPHIGHRDRVRVGVEAEPLDLMGGGRAGLSRARAPVMLAVLSGHTVVHRASTNARTTARARNWASETGVPSWLVSVNRGAWLAGSVVPGATASFPSTALSRGLTADCASGRLAELAVIRATRATASTTGTVAMVMITARLPVRLSLCDLTSDGRWFRL